MDGGYDQAGKKMSMVVGPWGGNGGSYWDEGSYRGIREISLVYGRCIDSIRVVYDKNGKSVAADKHGGTGGTQAAEIKLQYPEEFLTSVNGHYCPVVHGGSPVVRSLTFKSNLRTFGPYGVEEGTPFSLSADGAHIVGFKGRSGWYLDAVGFHLKYSTMDGGCDQAGKKMSIVVGPWGGNGGSYWDDGSCSGIREISLVYGHCIDSIRVVYDKNGKPVAAHKHGSSGGTQAAEIKLQYPEEFLTTVSGHYCPVVHGGSPVVRSLTFKSNRRTFGPYGVEEGTPFSLSADGAQIVGFKGRSGWYLDAVGFHLSKVETKNPYQKVQRKFKKLMSTVSMSSAQKDGEEP